MTDRRRPRRVGATLVALVRAVLGRPLASYYLLLASAALLLALGLTMVFSATSVEQYAVSGSAYTSIRDQAISAALGLFAFWCAQRTPVRVYRRLSRLGLVVTLVLVGLVTLLAVLVDFGLLEDPTLGPLGTYEMWVYLGPLQVQPSELAKFALMVWVADVLARKGMHVGAFRELFRPLFPVAIGLFLLVGYNDVGTMMCLMILFLGMLWAAGVRLRIFAGLAAVGAAGMAALVLIPLPVFQYRLDRLKAFVNPSAYEFREAVQPEAGLTALASGGWFGVGLGESRLKWGWLPNQQNDFIFAVIGEELGVVGCLVVLALFAVLTYAGVRIAVRCTHPFRRLAAAGITTLIAGQAIMNIGGVVGLLPVTGLPLPLISDGGTALVVTLAMIGTLASFARAEPAAAQALHARPPRRLAQILWAPLPPRPVLRPALRPGLLDDRAPDEEPVRGGTAGRADDDLGLERMR